MGWTSGLQLRILRGNHQGLVFPLKERQYLIGRAVDHQNAGPGRLFFHEPSVALVQAMLRWDEADQSYVLQIETSRGVNSISGIPLPCGVPRRVQSGSRLRMGDLVLALEKVGGKPIRLPKVEAELLPSMPLMGEKPPPPVVGEEPAVAPAEPEAPKTKPKLKARTKPKEKEADKASEKVALDTSRFRNRTYEPRPGEPLDGPVAEFFSDGSLKSLSIYRRGKLSETHARLLLEQGQEIGRVITHDSECSFSQGMETVLIQFEGEVDFSQTPTEWETWVSRWISLICAGSVVNLLRADS